MESYQDLYPSSLYGNKIWNSYTAQQVWECKGQGRSYGTENYYEFILPEHRNRILEMPPNGHDNKLAVTDGTGGYQLNKSICN